MLIFSIPAFAGGDIPGDVSWIGSATSCAHEFGTENFVN